MRIQDMTEEEFLRLSKEEQFKLLPDIMKKSILSTMWFKCRDDLYCAFYDTKSDKMLDEKYEVLSQLNKGVPSGKIKNYYKTMENYPKDGTVWDV